jgi:hypothetical protein
MRHEILSDVIMVPLTHGSCLFFHVGIYVVLGQITCRRAQYVDRHTQWAPFVHVEILDWL